MKNYFTSDLKGSKIFFPIFLLLLFVMGYSVVNAISSLEMRELSEQGMESIWTSNAIQGGDSIWAANAIIDGSYFIRLLSMIGFGILYMLVVYGLQFFIVKFTLGSLQLKGERVDTSEMKFGPFFVRVLGWTALTIVTCFIYSPWFTTNIIRYFAKHTSFKDKNFNFKGSGSALFGFIVLCYILPLFAIIIIAAIFTTIIPPTAVGFAGLFALVMLFVIFLLTSLLSAFLIRWMVDFEYDGKHITGTEMRYGKTMWFMFGQVMLTSITFGLYAPAFCLRTVRFG